MKSIKITKRNDKVILFFGIILTTLIAINLFFVTITFENNNIASADNNQPITIVNGMYDEEYTGSDYLKGDTTHTIRDYPDIRVLPNISDGLNQANYTNDDVIVKIIPRELFLQRGTYLYIGKEYGFFVKTEAAKQNVAFNDPIVSQYNNFSTVIVFDITNDTDLRANGDKVKVIVEPLYQYEFVYFSSQESTYPLKFMNGEYGDSKSLVSYNPQYANFIAPLARGYKTISFEQVDDFKVKDISFGANLMNEQALNYGDVGYDPYKDKGTFFEGAQYFYKGREIVAGDSTGETISSILTSGAFYILGLITGPVGKIFSIVGSATSMISTAVNAEYEKTVSVTNDNVSTVCYRTDRDRQLADDGCIVKSVGALVNTGESDTFIFGSGDYARQEFTIDNTSEGGPDNYTRMRRNIALKIVDSNYKFVTFNEGYSDIYLWDKQYDSLNIGNDAKVYLFPDGVNYFNFNAAYTGDYTIKVGGNESVVCTVDGNVIDSTNNQFNCTLQGGRSHKIVISRKPGSTSRIIQPISIEPSSNLNNVPVAANDNKIVKYTVGNGTAKQIGVYNGCSILKVLKVQNGALQDYEPAGYPIPSATSVTAPLPAGDYYIVIGNSSSTAKTTSVSLTECPSLNIGNTAVTLDGHMKYFKFTAPKAGSYAFTVNADNFGLFTTAYDATAAPIGAVVGTGTVKFGNLTAGQTIYVGFANSDSAAVSASINVREGKYSFAWYLDGKIVSNNNLDLEVGDTYDLYLLVNGTLKLTEFTYSATNEHKITLYNGKFKVDSTSATEGYFEIRAYSGIDEDNTYDTYLRVYPKAENKVEFYDFDYGEDFFNIYWRVNNPNVSSFTYEVSWGLIKKHYSTATVDTTTKKSGYFNAFDYTTSIASIKVKQIVLRGTARGYDTAASSTGSSLIFCKGDGSSAAPFEINCKRLFLLVGLNQNKDLCFKLTSDIDFNGTELGYNYFIGNLDGAGHTIKNLSIALNDEPASTVINYGFFKINEGVIKNLSFLNVNITSNVQHSGDWVNVGVVCGTNKGTIENVKVQGNITVKRNIASVGGIAGVNESTGNIKSCTMGYTGNSTFWVNSDTGGIIGNNKGYVAHCNTKNTTFKYYDSFNNRSIGGTVGFNSGTVERCAVTYCHFWIYGYSVNGTLDPVMGIIVGYMQSGSKLLKVGAADNTFDYDVIPSGNRNHLFKGNWGETGLTESNVTII